MTSQPPYADLERHVPEEEQRPRNWYADCDECRAGRCDDCDACRYFTAQRRSGWTAAYGFDDAPSVYSRRLPRLVARGRRLARWLGRGRR